MWNKDFIKYIIIITRDYDVSFSWRNICFFPITLWNIDNRCYHGSELVKNTSLRYLEAKLWHIALKWRPFWMLSSSGKRTRWNLGDFKYVARVGFNTLK